MNSIRPAHAGNTSVLLVLLLVPVPRTSLTFSRLTHLVAVNINLNDDSSVTVRARFLPVSERKINRWRGQQKEHGALSEELLRWIVHNLIYG